MWYYYTMITSLLLSAVLVSDTTVTITRQSRDMQMGRDKVTFDLTQTAIKLGCTKYTIVVPDMKINGNIYVWTGTLTCTK